MLGRALVATVLGRVTTPVQSMCECVCIYVLYTGVVAWGDIFTLALQFGEGSRVNADWGRRVET